MGICLEGDRDLTGKICVRTLTPLTLDIQTGVVSDEDTTEIWEDDFPSKVLHLCMI